MLSAECCQRKNSIPTWTGATAQIHFVLWASVEGSLCSRFSVPVNTEVNPNLHPAVITEKPTSSPSQEIILSYRPMNLRSLQIEKPSTCPTQMSFKAESYKRNNWCLWILLYKLSESEKKKWMIKVLHDNNSEMYIFHILTSLKSECIFLPADFHNHFWPDGGPGTVLKPHTGRNPALCVSFKKLLKDSEDKIWVPPTRTYFIAHETLFNVTWQPGGVGVWGRMDICICMAESLRLSTQNYHNIVNQLYLKTKKSFFLNTSSESYLKTFQWHILVGSSKPNL